MIQILQNENDVFWLINGQVKSRLNLNSTLQDLADFLVYEYNFERSNYGKLEFLFQNMIFNDYNLKLVDIGIFSEYLIDVKKETFPTFPMRPNTLYDRDHYKDYPDGVRFELSLRDKINFILESCLSNITKIGNIFTEVLKYKLARTDNRFEIHAIQQTINDIQNLTQTYLIEIRKNLREIE